ncbi:MAG: aminotransferase class IV, partial [Pseudomonadota bacterium]
MATALNIAWFNGQFAALADIRISPLDRGYLFGDGVYEVIPVYNGQPLGMAQHLDRLQQSIAAIALGGAPSNASITAMFKDLVAANGGGDMSLYLQVSRAGDDGRDHRYPEASGCNVFAMAAALSPPDVARYEAGVKLMQMQDLRWQRCDIKTTSLLSNVMARQHADLGGADEAFLVRDGNLTEGASSAIACIIDGVLTAPPEDAALLPSVTRALTWEIASAEGIPTAERALSVTEALAAEEMLLLSSTREIAPVVAVDT